MVIPVLPISTAPYRAMPSEAGLLRLIKCQSCGAPLRQNDCAYCGAFHHGHLSAHRDDHSVIAAIRIDELRIKIECLNAGIDESDPRFIPVHVLVYRRSHQCQQ